MQVAQQGRLLADGFSLGTQLWRGTGGAGLKVLCLHGWLDNSNSFKRLAPQLSTSGHEVLALDLPGHGYSSHFDARAGYPHIRHVKVVKDALDQLGWKPEETVLCGHSMGAGISLLFAGTFPERLAKLVLIDGFGPYVSKEDRAASNLRKAIESEEKMVTSPPKKYSTLGDAISARVRIVSTYRGSQSLSKEAAESLVRRGAFYPSESSEKASWENTQRTDLATGCLSLLENEGPVSFRYDPTLLQPSLSYLTKEQVDNFVAQITCPVLLAQAENGWPVDPAEYADRVKIISEKGKFIHKVLLGSHHLHLDPDTSAAVGSEVLDFLSRSSS